MGFVYQFLGEKGAHPQSRDNSSFPTLELSWEDLPSWCLQVGALGSNGEGYRVCSNTLLSRLLQGQHGKMLEGWGGWAVL